MLIFSFCLLAQEKVTISGYVKNGDDGTALPGATIYSVALERGVVANNEGYYELELDAGNHKLRYSYVGFASISKNIKAQKSKVVNVQLLSSQHNLSGVVIQSERLGQNIREPVMSVTRLDAKVIQQIPALMGEVDVIKAIQMLPGIQSTSEGSSGFSVRGGSPDQNLILLDDAAIYNASHMMGFFSVFNNDAVRDIKIYKGDIPAMYGGRLSSLLQVNTKEGSMEKWSATGGIGTISSRLTVETPIIKDKMSLIVSGRRTYADVFLLLSSDEFLRESKLHFYDLNGKWAWAIDKKNKITVSAYMGEDVYAMKYAAMSFGNRCLSARYTHLFSDKFFSDLSLHYSRYRYSMGTPEGEASGMDWNSEIADYSGRLGFTWYASESNTLNFGVSSSWVNILPSEILGKGEESIISDFIVPRTYGLESAAYVWSKQEIGNRLTAKYGLRFSLFQNVGPGTVYNYDSDFNAIDSTIYSSGDFYNAFDNFEPRVGLNYVLNDKSSLKASYMRTVQYMQLAQKSTSGSPLDVWFMAGKNVLPQKADQFALGLARNFEDNSFESSIEVYYKTIQNAIDFRDHAQLLVNKKLDGEIRTGKAESYGVEFMLKKVTGDLTGWISYTYSRSMKKISAINDGDFYPAPYDKPNDLAVILNYNLSKRLSLSANWVYSTGSPVTFPTGRAEYAGTIVRIYSDRNSYRMPDYHRLDFALSWKSKPSKKRWNYTWVFSVYNLYNRHNAWTINFQQEEDNPEVTYAEMTYLFGIIPSITFNFNF